MEELMQELVDTVANDRTTAEKVIAFLPDPAADLVQAWSAPALADQRAGGLGGRI